MRECKQSLGRLGDDDDGCHPEIGISIDARLPDCQTARVQEMHVIKINIITVYSTSLDTVSATGTSVLASSLSDAKVSARRKAAKLGSLQ